MPSLDDILWEEKPIDKYVTTKNTLVNSPIILKFFPNFKVNLLKPLSGLPSSSINDEKEQTLQAPEEDSYFGDGISDNEDDDILWNSIDEDNSMNPETESKATDPEYVSAEVIVKAQSVVVDGIEFPFTAGVRDCAKIISPFKDEDSLFVSLKSGFLLLIRLWRVPRTFTDANFALSRSSSELNGSPSSLHLHILKPFIVQWWKTSTSSRDAPKQTNSMSAISMDTSGAQVHAHSTGLSVVSTSACSVFRIYLTQQTPYGLQLSPHFNVPVDGSILLSCFADPIIHQAGNNLMMFLIMTCSQYRRLDLTLFSWYVLDSLTNNLKKTTLPLGSDFPMPLFVIPLSHSKAFLFISPTQLIIVSAHNILLADYSFIYFKYPGTFPTAFHKPQSPIIASLEEDEILIASDNGVIYSVVIEDTLDIVTRPLMRIPEVISDFNLSADTEDGSYILTFASDAGNNRTLIVPEIFNDDYVASIGVGETKLAYSDAILARDLKNWAPIIDMKIINHINSRNISPYTTQELWMITGSQKRTKLTNLSIGYPARKESIIYRDLRKCSSLFSVSNSEQQYYITSSAFESLLLVNEVDESVDYKLNRVGVSYIIHDNATLLAQNISPDTVLQVTPTGIAFTDFKNCMKKNLDGVILFASLTNNVLFLIIEVGNSTKLFIYKVNGLEGNDEESLLIYVSTTDLEFQPSMMKLFFSENLVLVCGGFDEIIRYMVIDENLNASLHSHFSLRDKVLEFPKILNEPLIPNDCVWSQTLGILYLGTKAGLLFEIDISKDINLIVNYHALGTTAVKLHLSKNDDHLLFVYLRNFWLINLYESRLPYPVAFEERSDRSVSHITELDCDEQYRARFAFARDDGVLVGSVFCNRSPLVKHITIGDAAKKLIYLDNLETFVMLCRSKDPASRIKFADRKSNRMLPCLEIDTKLNQQRAIPIFDLNEYPTCSFVWEILRNDRVSKKLIVGCTGEGDSGSIKILDVSKCTITQDDSVRVKVTELISIARDEPVTCILQLGSTIFFAAGRKIYSTSYSLQDRKLRPVNTLTTLSSDIVSMSVSEDLQLVVSTRLDSAIAFSYTEGTELLPEGLEVQFNDPHARCLVNHVKVGDFLFISDKLHSSVYEFNPSQEESCVLKTTLIPRLFASRNFGIWAAGSDSEYLVCVGVNGEITAIGKKPADLSQLSDVKKQLEALRDVENIEELQERLDRPFVDKVTGKCFQSAYKPFFAFKKAPANYVDYDLEDLACPSGSVWRL